MRTKKNFTGYYIKRGAIAVVTIAISVWWMFGDSWRASNRQLESAQNWIRGMPGYQSHAAYMDRLVEKHHDSAFPRTYSRGTRGSLARFDRDRYHYLLINGMANEAERDGRKEIADTLRRAYSAYVKK